MINVSSAYPGKVDAPSAAYPYGEARNITTPGDGTGTPLEEKWVNDFFGLAQAAVSQASIVPNGNPDSVANPQIFNALKRAKEFQSIAEMKTIEGAYDKETRILVERGGVGGTGGGFGQFYWDATSTETADDYLIVDVTGVPTGRWKRRYASHVFAEWFGDVSVDAGLAINNAFASGALHVAIGTEGELPLLTGILITVNGQTLSGLGNEITILKKSGSIDAITVSASRNGITDLRVDSDLTDVLKDGIVLAPGANRAYIDRVSVWNQSRHGFNPLAGNNHYFGAIYAVDNGGDGFYIEGSEADSNTGRVVYLDTRGNGGNGISIGTGGVFGANWTIDVVAQANTGYGVECDSRLNVITCYCESNLGGDQTYLGANAKGCYIKATLGNVNSSATDGSNFIWSQEGGVAEPAIRNLDAVSMRIPRYGTTGDLTIKRNAIRDYYVEAGGSSANQDITFRNAQAPTYRLNMSVDGALTVNYGALISGVLTLGSANGLKIADYIVHDGDPNTYFGFNADDNWSLVAASITAMDVDSAGTLRLPVVGPHAVGGVRSNVVQWLQTGSFSSDGSSNFAAAQRLVSTIVGASGDTNFLAGAQTAVTINTQDDSDTIGDVAAHIFAPPTINKGASDTITAGETILVTGQPTAGNSNFGIKLEDCSLGLAGFTIANLPAASQSIRGVAWATDDVTGARPVYSDGTNWRRFNDDSIASAT